MKHTNITKMLKQAVKPVIDCSLFLIVVVGLVMVSLILNTFEVRDR